MDSVWSGIRRLLHGLIDGLRSPPKNNDYHMVMNTDVTVMEKENDVVWFACGDVEEPVMSGF